MGKYLRGEQQPGFDVLLRIVEKTGVSLDWLLLGDGGDQPQYREQRWTPATLDEELTVRLRHAYDAAARREPFQAGPTGRTFGVGWGWRTDAVGFLRDAIDAEIAATRARCAWEGGAGVVAGRVDQLRSALERTPDSTAISALDALVAEIHQQTEPRRAHVMPLAVVGTVALKHQAIEPGTARIVHDGEISDNGGPWTPAFSAWPDLSFPMDLSGFPSGTVLSLRLRCCDLTDGAVSQWSEVLTVTVQHPEQSVT